MRNWYDEKEVSSNEYKIILVVEALRIKCGYAHTYKNELNPHKLYQVNK